MSIARSLVLALMLLSTAAWTRDAASPSAGNAAATLERDTTRCRAYAELNACYDAIRWSPGDPSLLVALGDALVRAQRPADAIRNYRRAAALAPDTRGLAAKISAAEARVRSGRAPGNQPVDRASINAVPGKRYSNSAPVAQSH